MAKVNKYENGAASIEFVSNKYIKVSCTQSNEITIGATAVCNGGVICMFDALPVAFASTDGLDINLKAGVEVDISKTSFKKTGTKGSVKTLAVSSCTNTVENCIQKIGIISANTSLLTAENIVYGQKRDLISQMTEINTTHQNISDKMNKVSTRLAESNGQQINLSRLIREQVNQMTQTIDQLKEVETKLKEIIRQKSSVGAAKSEKGGTFSKSSGILNM